MHDGNTDESVEVGRVGYEADYGNRRVWNLEFPRLQKDLESLILNRLTSCVVSLSVSTCLSLQIKKKHHFRTRTLNPFASVPLSLTLIDSSSVKVSTWPQTRSYIFLL